MSTHKLVSNILSLGVVQLVNYIFPLITTPYISRIIGPDGYGILNYSTAFIGYFSLLIGYGFDMTATRRISLNSTNKRYVNNIASEVLWSRVFLFILATILFILALFSLEPLSDKKVVASILMVGCISNVISPQFIFQGKQELTIFSKINFVKGLLNVILVFLLIKNKGDYIWLATLTSLFSIIVNLSLCIIAIRKFKITYKFVNLKRIFHLLNSEKNYFISSVLFGFYLSTNIVVLGFFSTAKEVGYLTSSVTFMSTVNSVITAPISIALFPFVGKAFSISRECGVDTVKKIIPIVFYITLIACVILFLMAPVFIKMFYGTDFIAAILPLKIIAFLPLVGMMFNMFGVQIILNLKLDKVYMKIMIFVCLIGFLSNVIMAKYYNYVGCAVNMLLTEILLTISMFLYLKKLDINVLQISYFKFSNILQYLKSSFTSNER